MIRVVHSPDADDALLFWAIRNGAIDCGNLQFEFSTADTHALNLATGKNDFDIFAISAVHYPNIADSYYPMRSGASVGRGFGPVLVTRRPCRLEELADARIAVPGLSTTAARVTRLLLPRARLHQIRIEPFDAIFRALQSDEVDAGVIIHEGQICYPRFGMYLVADLGEWWSHRFGLPLVLGINVCRRSLGGNLAAAIDDCVSRSVSYALEHLDDALGEIMQQRLAADCALTTREEFLRYLSMYANRDSIWMDHDCLQGLAALWQLEEENSEYDTQPQMDSKTPLDYFPRATPSAGSVRSEYKRKSR